MKTLSKLTIKSLLMNKTRTLVTIIGIMLSAALITVVAGVFTSAQATLISSCIHESGDYDIVLDGSFTDENIKKLNMNRDIQDIGYRQYVGMAEIENTTSKYRNMPLYLRLIKQPLTPYIICLLNQADIRKILKRSYFRRPL